LETIEVDGHDLTINFIDSVSSMTIQDTNVAVSTRLVSRVYIWTGELHASLATLKSHSLATMTTLQIQRCLSIGMPSDLMPRENQLPQ
jgi:hypothetical protein